MQRVSSRRRPGMTLIEILVVIAILAILASLTLVGVMKFIATGPATLNKHDISQLTIALERFKTDYKFYPPSRIRLCSNYAQYTATNTQLDKDSISFLSMMWPNMTIANLNWDGAGTANQSYILEGDQCLVFFLGGLPSPGGGLQGFSTNPTNPTAPGGDRKKHFDFEVGRLVLRSGPFPSYLDAYKTKPFVYFSAGNKGPDRYDPTPNSLGVAPYTQQTAPTVKYHNGTTFQIISAGVDGQFGPGGLWTQATAGSIAPAGRDDMTNFYSNMMGIQ